MKAVWTTDSRDGALRGPGHRGGRGRHARVAEDAARLVEVDLRREALQSPTSRGHEGRRAAASSTPSGCPAAATGPRNGQRRRPAPAPRPTAATSTRASPRPTSCIEATYHVPVHTHAPPRDARRRRRRGRATSSRSTPPPRASSRCATGVAEALGIDRKNVRVLTEHMGGGFGSKLGALGHSAAPSRSSPAGSRRRPGAPVKLMLDRQRSTSAPATRRARS